MRVVLLGATGTAGRATAAALIAGGHEVICPVRRPVGFDGARELLVDVTDVDALTVALRPERPDAAVSCLASRTGAPMDAWAIDRDTTIAAFSAARDAGANRAVLLSAICVQKPKLAFQHAKLEAEAWLAASDLSWTVVRPTALFKSLSGQVARVQAGKPWLLFGDGRLTATKPISDRDLGRFIARTLTDERAPGQVLPIGGPGPAQTPREMAEAVFRLTGRAPRFRRVPTTLMDGIVGGLSLAARVRPSLAEKAEFARIGRYYATESMLVWDERRQCYDADATPEFGGDRIEDHFARLLSGEGRADLGAHAVFGPA